MKAKSGTAMRASPKPMAERMRVEAKMTTRMKSTPAWIRSSPG
jgi:hypothetical protein